jgi:hypothetical protein
MSHQLTDDIQALRDTISTNPMTGVLPLTRMEGRQILDLMLQMANALQELAGEPDRPMM